MSAVNQTSFFHPKNVRFLILNWHGQLTQTEQLIDCSLISVQPIKNKSLIQQLNCPELACLTIA